MNENEIMAAGGNLPAVTGQMTVAALKEQVQIIQQVLTSVMIKGVHYAEVPGTGKWVKGKNGKWEYIPGKPALLKAGVEKINMVFGIGGDPEIDKEFDGFDTHFHVRVRMFNNRTGNTIGYGVGEGSTAESKYAWRKAVCDAEFDATPETRRRIHWQKQESGDDKKEPTYIAVKQVRQNPADIINTVLKMAVKRADVDGCRKVTACSDVFDQDLDEDHIREAVTEGNTPPPPEQPQYQRPQRTDANAANSNGNAPVDANVISEAQRKRLYAIGKEKGLSVEEMGYIVFEVAGVSHSNEIPRQKYDAVVEAYQNATPGKVMPGNEVEDGNLI